MHAHTRTRSHTHTHSRARTHTHTHTKKKFAVFALFSAARRSDERVCRNQRIYTFVGGKKGKEKVRRRDENIKVEGGSWQLRTAARM